MEGVKLEFGKFNGSNYSAWKFKMKPFLMQKGVWKAVAGEDIHADTDEKALVMIGLSVNDDQVVYVQDAKTAKEAWDNLAAVYENTGTASKMYLQEKLMTAKLTENKSAKDHIEEMKMLVSQLAGIGAKVSDDEYKIALLRSLPGSYESLILTLENLVDKLKIEDIHARILRELRQKSNEIGNSRAKMFAAKSNLSNIVC